MPLSRLQKFLALDVHRRGLLLEAARLLAQKRLGLRLGSFKAEIRKFRQVAEVPAQGPLSATQEQLAREFAAAIRLVARHAPWECACLVQALALADYLQRKRVPGCLVLGLAKGLELEQGQELSAHAWLQTGGEIVIGREGHETFTVVAGFAWGMDG